jgi:peptidoglycan/xylan/chitin deacetylase (PgdA/CDA1 family)/CelD/BcsL family acetyltransferase involved in cellulose biosynthesis
MRVLEVREETDLQRLRGSWNNLLGQSASRTIFLTWEWISAWWSAYGNSGELRILAAFDDGGELRGIAPLREQQVHQYGQTVTGLSFLGDGSIGSDFNDSDYLDFIVAPGYEEPVLEAFLTRWAESLDPGTVLLLNEIPETSPNLPVLQRMAESRGMHWSCTNVPCATVGLPANWNDYLQKLQPRFRTKIRSVLRNLENRGDVRFAFCEHPDELERLLPALFDLHTRRWARGGKPGVFGLNSKRDFYSRLSGLLLEMRSLRFSYLDWKGKILACQYGFIYQNTYSQLQEGYEPASEHWNLGVGLRAWSIREFLKEGLTEYDFLGGVSRHKSDWGAETKTSRRIVLACQNRKNLLFLNGPKWELAAKESVRKLVPEIVLEKRREIRSGQPLTSTAWARNAAAHCYFYSGMPAVVRCLRKRYQISVGSNGNWRTLSWAKRKQIAARILCYHRVNDENDPFFEAISTRAFAQHMEYLSRCYTVVSISEIMRHLEDGTSKESLVGITLDDGYRDNFENAFPILQRYGLPATIFLTTGSIDSGEPLWFERLAEAVKKTKKEHLDLEIDIPRRFWMRTTPERLDANRQIFLVLRSLDNAERTCWLQEILKYLGAPCESERRNKMLTWEQIRLMNANRIDFGGHTVTHPFLSKLTPSEAAWEISESKRRIEEELQQLVHYFAYPNGREDDFAAWSGDLLRAAGYQAAMTTRWGINYPWTDRMQLKRGGPWETDPALFAYKLDWYQLAHQ